MLSEFYACGNVFEMGRNWRVRRELIITFIGPTLKFIFILKCPTITKIQLKATLKRIGLDCAVFYVPANTV